MSLYNDIVNKDIKTYNTLIDNLAKDLSKITELAKYSVYKSGVSKERVPLNEDWIYHRTASMLIKMIEHPRSVKFFRLHYSSLKNRGVKPNKTYMASGYIIRHVLQILETKGYVIGSKKGRYASQTTKKEIYKLNQRLCA